MKKNQKLFSILTAVVIFMFVLAGCGSLVSDTVSEDNDILQVHFIDVGQADAIFLKTPSGKNVLIDGGNNDDEEFIVEYLKKQGVETLDYVIGTHPHEDHIGGLDAAISDFDIGSVYLPKVAHTTKTYEDLLLSIKNKNLKIKEAKSGVKLDLDEEIEAYFLAPVSTGYESLNNYSAVLKITYEDTSFLFTGDAEKESEEEMLDNDFDLKADVLKVGHHGSVTSTTEEFLKEVSPSYAVIFAGKNNKYGHPHKEVVERLLDFGVKIYRTDQDGTIIATSDGSTISFNK